MIFKIEPIPKVRMTRGDRWKQRPCVIRYWQYKADLQHIALSNDYIMGDTLNLKFYITMPKSWSKRKRGIMNEQPHQAKPDIDNLVKAFMDCLSNEDSNVWKIQAEKYWSENGSIEIN